MARPMTSGNKTQPAASRTTSETVRAKRPAKRFRSSCIAWSASGPLAVVIDWGRYPSLRLELMHDRSTGPRSAERTHDPTRTTHHQLRETHDEADLSILGTNRTCGEDAGNPLLQRRRSSSKRRGSHFRSIRRFASETIPGGQR